MAEAITIRSGTFRAEILIDKLPTLTLPKIRRLVRLMSSDPDENTVSIQEIKDWSAQLVLDAKEQWRAASNVYADGYRDPKHAPNEKKAKSTNMKLRAALRAAKAAYDRTVKIKTIIDTEL